MHNRSHPKGCNALIPRIQLHHTLITTNRIPSRCSTLLQYADWSTQLFFRHEPVMIMCDFTCLMRITLWCVFLCRYVSYKHCTCFKKFNLAYLFASNCLYLHTFNSISSISSNENMTNGWTS